MDEIGAGERGAGVRRVALEVDVALDPGETAPDAPPGGDLGPGLERVADGLPHPDPVLHDVLRPLRHADVGAHGAPALERQEAGDLLVVQTGEQAVRPLIVALLLPHANARAKLPDASGHLPRRASQKAHDHAGGVGLVLPAHRLESPGHPRQALPAPGGVALPAFAPEQPPAVQDPVSAAQVPSIAADERGGHLSGGLVGAGRVGEVPDLPEVRAAGPPDRLEVRLLAAERGEKAQVHALVEGPEERAIELQDRAPRRPVGLSRPGQRVLVVAAGRSVRAQREPSLRLHREEEVRERRGPRRLEHQGRQVVAEAGTQPQEDRQPGVDVRVAHVLAVARSDEAERHLAGAAVAAGPDEVVVDLVVVASLDSADRARHEHLPSVGLLQRLPALVVEGEAQRLVVVDLRGDRDARLESPAPGGEPALAEVEVALVVLLRDLEVDGDLRVSRDEEAIRELDLAARVVHDVVAVLSALQKPPIHPDALRPGHDHSGRVQARAGQDVGPLLSLLPPELQGSEVAPRRGRDPAPVRRATPERGLRPRQATVEPGESGSRPPPDEVSERGRSPRRVHPDQHLVELFESLGVALRLERDVLVRELRGELDVGSDASRHAHAERLLNRGVLVGAGLDGDGLRARDDEILVDGARQLSLGSERLDGRGGDEGVLGARLLGLELHELPGKVEGNPGVVDLERLPGKERTREGEHPGVGVEAVLDLRGERRAASPDPLRPVEKKAVGQGVPGHRLHPADEGLGRVGRGHPLRRDAGGKDEQDRGHGGPRKEACSHPSSAVRTMR